MNKHPAPTPTEIVKAEARAKAVKAAEVTFAAAGALVQETLDIMNGRRPADKIAGIYGEGKYLLRELLTCYNRLSLFLDLPDAVPAKDPKHSTTVAMPVPDAVKDHDAP